MIKDKALTGDEYLEKLDVVTLGYNVALTQSHIHSYWQLKLTIEVLQSRS